MDIEKGLFQFDLTDYHAILGVSLDADAKQIRKRYLAIARKLHPDSQLSSSEADKQQAHEILSKLVNPAYEKLTQEKMITEHLVVLRLRGQQLSRQAAPIELSSDVAKDLIKHGNAAPLYASALKQLADEQYESLDRVIAVTEQISELNLAYLVNTAKGIAAATPTSTTPPATLPPNTPAPGNAEPTPHPSAKTAPPPPPKRTSIIDSYLNRANELARRKKYTQAILEMREAVKTNPNHAQCHSQLADYYLRSGQATMAKVHLKRALSLDPKNDLATQLNAKVNKAAPKKAVSGSVKTPQAKSKGGLFGLFGGKQK
jgi:curved DNA-binding protein CbpA